MNKRIQLKASLTMNPILFSHMFLVLIMSPLINIFAFSDHVYDLNWARKTVTNLTIFGPFKFSNSPKYSIPLLIAEARPNSFLLSSSSPKFEISDEEASWNVQIQDVDIYFGYISFDEEPHINRLIKLLKEIKRSSQSNFNTVKDKINAFNEYLLHHNLELELFRDSINVTTYDKVFEDGELDLEMAIHFRDPGIFHIEGVCVFKFDTTDGNKSVILELGMKKFQRQDEVIQKANVKVLLGLGIVEKDKKIIQHFREEYKKAVDTYTLVSNELKIEEITSDTISGKKYDEVPKTKEKEGEEDKEENKEQEKEKLGEDDEEDNKEKEKEKEGEDDEGDNKEKEKEGEGEEEEPVPEKTKTPKKKTNYWWAWGLGILVGGLLILCLSLKAWEILGNKHKKKKKIPASK